MSGLPQFPTVDGLEAGQWCPTGTGDGTHTPFVEYVPLSPLCLSPVTLTTNGPQNPDRRLVCMRDVKEVPTTVCRHVPSAFLCEQNGVVWTFESQVSFPSYQTNPDRCRVCVCCSLQPCRHRGAQEAARRVLRGVPRLQLPP